MASVIAAGLTSGTAISVSGDTSGQLVLQTNGTTTAVTISTGQVVTLAQPLPVASGGSGVITSTGSGANALATSPTLTTPVLSGSVTGTYTLAGTPTMGASLITSGTAVASTSGTSIDFTSIPSWVKRVTVMFNGVSTNGTSFRLVQIGSGSITSSGYISSSQQTGASSDFQSSTSGYMMCGTSISCQFNEVVTLTTPGSNIWKATHNGSMFIPASSYYEMHGGGTVTLSGALDRVRITTVNGTDTFDAGSINILYE